MDQIDTKSHRLKVTRSVVPRTAVAAVYLVVLLAFFLVQGGFSLLYGPPPRPVFVLVALAASLRLLEIAYARAHSQMSVHATLRLSSLSIAWNLALPLMLAVVTRQSHTHYFGMLTLPVLEAALFFSFTTTLCIAAVASSISAFWVAYAAHFQPPFQFGELLEATTLILVQFIIASLVWWLVDLLSEREDELQEKLMDLEIARSKLIEGEKLAAVGRLASAVAHEIRNPVAIISSALEASASDEFSAEDREEMSRVAVLESRRLEKLTTDFLSYAQPGSGPFVELDATALVGYIVSIVRPQAHPKNLTIDLTTCDDCRVYGNEGQLQQVLLNLMRNAIEASPERAHIKIKVGWHSREMIRIGLENAGPPIPKSAVFQIFEPFFTAKKGGTGLGLSIARSIIEKHEGRLLLERNEPNHIVFAAMVPASIPQSLNTIHRTKESKEKWQEF